MKASTQKSKATELVKLRLYLAGQTPRSMAALANLKKLCKEHLDRSHQASQRIQFIVRS